jgi:hypothetical protein
MGELRDGARVQTFIDGWSPAVNDVNDLNDQSIACVKPYTSLYAGIVDTNPGNVFEVQHATSCPAPLSTALAYDVGHVIDSVCSDGKNFYHAYGAGAGGTFIRANRKDTGAQVWDIDAGAVAIPAGGNALMFSDGLHVYYPDQDGDELVALNVADGTEASRVAMNGAGVPYYVHGNGLYVLVGCYTTDELQVFKWVGAALVYQYKFSHGDTVFYPFCGDTFGIYCGVTDPANSKIVVVFTLATGVEICSYASTLWNVAPAYAVQPWSDGNFVYFGTSRARIVAGGDYGCVWKASLTAGTLAGILAWGIDRGVAGPESWRTCGDGRHLYSFLSTGNVEQLDIETLEVVKVLVLGAGPPTFLFEASDGEYVIGYHNVAPNYYLQALDTGISTRKYVRCTASTSAVRRFPCQGMLAIPLT